MTSTSTVHKQSSRSRLSQPAPNAAGPRGLGAPGALVPSAHPCGSRLLRQATLAKWGHMQAAGGGGRGPAPPAALPLFDVSVAVLASIDDLRGSDAALHATLHAPAHRVLECQAEAYGSPFSAPALQSLEHGDLSENDKEFGACLAAPPEMEEPERLTVKHRLIRMASLARMQRPEAHELSSHRSTTMRSAASGAEAKLRLMVDASLRGRAPATRTRSNAEDADAARAASDAAAARDQQGSITTARDTPAEALLAACGDPVAALVGLGALLVRGFGARAAEAVAAGSLERRARALVRAASTISEPARAARRASVDRPRALPVVAGEA